MHIKKIIQNLKSESTALTNLAASLASRNLLTNGMKAWMSEVMDSASGCRKSSSPSTFCIDLNTEIDTIEYQETEKIETEVKDDDRIRKHTGVRRLSRVSFWGIPFSQYHILVHPCQQTPLKKGNSQMESSVQDNPAAPSPCQYTLKALLNSVLGK